MAPKTCLLGLAVASLANSCVEDPVVSMPVSDGGSDSPTTLALDPPASTTAAELPTTSEPTTTGTSSLEEVTTTSGPVGTLCGDGILGEQEECDDGGLNSDDGACTIDCKTATCGDRLIHTGAEECDLGPNNDDSYGGCLACKLGPRCGDGILQPEYEKCDHGALNGTNRPSDGAAPCTMTCRYYGRLMFMTTEVFSGNLGGVSGADLECQLAAAAAKLPHPHTYRAWISDNFQSPKERFKQWDLPDVPVYLLDGRLVAHDLVELVNYGPLTGISCTELGAVVVDRYVWTNTSAFGETFKIDAHCDGWLSGDGALEARQGLNGLQFEAGAEWDEWRSARWWTSVASRRCHEVAHLYCIDDGFVPESEG